MTLLLEQLTTRDAALLTWMAVGAFCIGWSIVRGGGIGRAALAVLRALLAARIISMIVLVIAWQLAVVQFAERAGLWDFGLLKDTVGLVLVGALLCGFKALAFMEGKASWRSEVRSLTTLVVVVQFVSNLQTFPYVVELLIVPLALVLGGVQAVANHDEEYQALRPILNGAVTLFGFAILAWSVYRLVASFGSTSWDTVGKSFALAFWLPAALLPAIYVAALVMQYGKTFTIMKIVRPQPVGARLQFLSHHGLSLRRLSAFAHTPGRAREYARAATREERRAVLQRASP